MAAMLDPTCQDSQEMNPSLPPDFGDGICQTLSPYFDEAAAEACKLTSQIPQEEVGIDQPIPSLPGCNLPWAGPGFPSTKPTCNPAPATPLIGNPSKFFTWDFPRANVDPPTLVPVYDGFNPAPIHTTMTTSIKSTTTSSSAPTVSTVCVAGTGPGNYLGLCNFACEFGYCPTGVCTCTAIGNTIPPPPSSGYNGAPLSGEDNSYLGLCSFCCSHGYCPSTACMKT
jgi:hypothetical protein